MTPVHPNRHLDRRQNCKFLPGFTGWLLLLFALALALNLLNCSLLKLLFFFFGNHTCVFVWWWGGGGGVKVYKYKCDQMGLEPLNQETNSSSLTQTKNSD